MSRWPRMLLLVLSAMLLGGCMASSPPAGLIRENALAEEGALISSEPGETYRSEYQATLYFRYLDEPLLAGETRTLTVPRDQTPELAIVQALLDGPSAAQPSLGALFPAQTAVLNTLAQGGTLYVTFDEHLLDRYDDEPQALSAAYVAGEGALRRRLAMGSLAASLIEYGGYRSVQVLVRQQGQITSSMRLTEEYYLSASDALLAPLTRDESLLLTPLNTAQTLLAAWQEQDWQRLYGYLAARESGGGQARPSQQAAAAAMEAGLRLLSFTVSAGSVSGDGQTSVHCADLTLCDASGMLTELRACPLRLCRENGIWKISYGELAGLMQAP